MSEEILTRDKVLRVLEGLYEEITMIYGDSDEEYPMGLLTRCSEAYSILQQAKREGKL